MVNQHWLSDLPTGKSSVFLVISSSYQKNCNPAIPLIPDSRVAHQKRSWSASIRQPRTSGRSKEDVIDIINIGIEVLVRTSLYYAFRELGKTSARASINSHKGLF